MTKQSIEGVGFVTSHSPMILPEKDSYGVQRSLNKIGVSMTGEFSPTGNKTTPECKIYLGYSVCEVRTAR